MGRMRVEVSVGGGKVSDKPSQATHIVVLLVPGYELDFETLLQSFPDDQKRILHRRKLHVVGSQWLEDCFKEDKKLPEEAYNLKPNSLEGLNFEEEEDANEMDYEKCSAFVADEEKPKKPVVEKTTPKITAALVNEPRRKRGRPAGASTRKGKAIVTSRPPRTKRARVGKRPAKLQEIASDDEMSEEKDESGNPDPDFEGHDQFPEETVSIEQETEKNGVEQGSGSLERNEGYKDDEGKSQIDQSKDPGLDAIASVTCSKPDKGRDDTSYGKLEVKVDPVQAMLLDMLPSLGMERSEDTDPVIQYSNLAPMVSKEGSSSVVPREQPVKKKVSYKELARQLLED